MGFASGRTTLVLLLLLLQVNEFCAFGIFPHAAFTPLSKSLPSKCRTLVVGKTVRPSALSLASTEDPKEADQEEEQLTLVVGANGDVSLYDQAVADLQACAQCTSWDPKAVERGEAIIDSMTDDENFVILPVEALNGLLEVHAYSGRGAPAVLRVEELWNRMLQGETAPPPNEESVAIVMEAFIQAQEWQKLDDFWNSLVFDNKMEQPLTTNLYNKRLRSLGRQGKPLEAEQIFRCMLMEPIDEEIFPNGKTWVHMLRGYASQVGRTHAVLERDDPFYLDDDTLLARIQEFMRDMARGSKKRPDWVPTTDAYNCLLRAISRHSSLPTRSTSAESVLFGMMEEYRKDKAFMRPNADSFYHTLQALRGDKHAKVLSVWELQTALWNQVRQSGNVTAAHALVPSVRNLNAALAALARTSDTHKASRAQEMLQSMESIRRDYQPAPGLPPVALEPNTGTYKQIVSACAFPTGKLSPRDKKEALEIALDVRQTFATQDQLAVDSTVYKLLIQAVGNLVESGDRKDTLVSEIFTECCERGLVNPSVVRALERAASKGLVLQTLGGFAEDILGLPSDWTANAL